MINLYQIYFKPEQLSTLDPAFIPYDNINPKISADLSNKLREWPIIREHGYERAKQDKSDIWGFVSYKFQEKTNTTGSQFVKFINDNPDNDVWFMEPKYFPQSPFKNVWHQGECHHPGIVDLANRILGKMGNKINVWDLQTHYCWYNFFAGNDRFWNLYFKVIDKIIEVSNKDPEIHKMMFETGAGHGNDGTVPYFIFVVERMFPTVLALSNLRSANYLYEHRDFVFG